MNRMRCASLQALAVGWLALSCQVHDDIDGRAWPCDLAATVDQCGTRGGRRMLCWEGFCTPSCDVAKPVAEGFECLSSGALVQTCHPSLDDCSGQMSCLRTDLLSDEGLCTYVPVCAGNKDNKDNKDCTEPARNTCAGTILHNLAGEATFVHTDHLHCVQEGCASGGSNCLPEESCLAKEYAIAGDLPDICVPKCDANLQCPPNYACAQSSAEPGPERLCLPGLPGVRCTSDTDCLIGSCVDTHAGFSVCTLPCVADEGCSYLNNSAAYYLCVASAPGEDKHCLTARPFQGANCDLDRPGECPPDQMCFDFDPNTPFAFQARGECRTPCNEDLSCPALGGLAHVCLGGGKGGCYPGNFGLPCESTEACLRPLVCERTASSAASAICTSACKDDKDCTLWPETIPGGFCEGRFCRPQLASGAPCASNAQCKSGKCMNVPEGTCFE